ncbi:hypothetical protein HRW23_34770 [Streptomyces lunaelactis]|uniref:hypothetical protein n=1 Tax=Streptomyces lunaelactis TaxID=1535768 RepID=UPI001584680F|nr:hypothetical protein [Streptomyces lunaelactis]NUK10061.1 hypothetical protein [Streptomyces lunaelactis]NUK35339.1 hypothetical protein [Streptomyces lunaelactis]NUK40978.1 hypothetical protein [Streptomyces lunaelactis]NUK58835.1 hypothetical protein [Streptomyces lunaelactis]NUK71042.1 hypothetical protein [Streptomyces lunaelactis]
MSGRPRLWVAGALVGVTASVLTCGLAVVAVVLVPTWWPHPVVAAVAVLLLLGLGFALISVCFVRLDPWHFGAAAIVECLLAVGLLTLLDQAVLDVWGKPLQTVVTKAVRHERNAPTGKVTGSWWECSLERLDGTELERNLRESDFVSLGKACPADAEAGDRLVVYAAPGGFAAPQTNAPVGGVWLVVAFTAAATVAAATFTSVGMTRAGAPEAGRILRLIRGSRAEDSPPART